MTYHEAITTLLHMRRYGATTKALVAFFNTPDGYRYFGAEGDRLGWTPEETMKAFCDRAALTSAPLSYPGGVTGRKPEGVDFGPTFTSRLHRPAPPLELDPAGAYLALEARVAAAETAKQLADQRAQAADRRAETLRAENRHLQEKLRATASDLAAPILDAVDSQMAERIHQADSPLYKALANQCSGLAEELKGSNKREAALACELEAARARIAEWKERHSLACDSAEKAHTNRSNHAAILRERNERQARTIEHWQAAYNDQRSMLDYLSRSFDRAHLRWSPFALVWNGKHGTLEEVLRKRLRLEGRASPGWKLNVAGEDMP